MASAAATGLVPGDDAAQVRAHGVDACPARKSGVSLFSPLLA